MIKECPRCGNHSLECLKTHSYCASCNYDCESHWKEEAGTNSWIGLLNELQSISVGQPINLMAKDHRDDGSEAA